MIFLLDFQARLQGWFSTMRQTWIVNVVRSKQLLSGSPTKSCPLDFGTKISFPSFFVCEKGLVNINKKAVLLFFNSLFLSCYEPKLPTVIRKMNFTDFVKRARSIYWVHISREEWNDVKVSYEIVHTGTAVVDESEEWSSQLIFKFKQLERRSLAPNVWLHSSVGRASHRYLRRSRVRIPLKPWFFQASSFQCLNWNINCDESFFTFIVSLIDN